MEPWERNSGAAEPCGEQGCLVTWKEAGSETKEEREVQRRRHHQLQVPFVGSSGVFKSQFKAETSEVFQGLAELLNERGLIAQLLAPSKVKAYY